MMTRFDKTEEQISEGKRYHGFIVEYQLHRDPWNPYWVIPFTQKKIGGKRYYRYDDSIRLETETLAIAWGKTWREQGL